MIENWKNALDNKKVIAALSMDLSKAFDCLQHDLVIAKLHAYGFEMQALKVIYFYLSNRFQSVRVKDTYSSANKIKPGVPQGSLLGVILFNSKFNDILDIIDEAELYNYPDDNNLSAVGDSTIEAKNILKQQTTVVFEWFDQNHLVANTEKFHLMFLSTDKTGQLVNEQLFIGDKTLNNEPCITLLGMDIDNLLTFNKHIANLCKKVASQLNVLKRLSRSMGHTERKLIMQVFTLSNFDYCALIWHFCSESNTAKIEKIQDRALRLVLDDHILGYPTLLGKAATDPLKTKRIKMLAMEIYKTIYSINPNYMKEIFKMNKSQNYNFRSDNVLKVGRFNMVKYGRNSLRTLGPQIWNSLPNKYKMAVNLNQLKKFMKLWSGPKCSCNICKYIN